MPKTIVTLTVLPADASRGGDRHVQFDSDSPDVRRQALVAFMEAHWEGWQNGPTEVEDAPNIAEHPSLVLWVRGGMFAVDELIEATRRKLRHFPNVEVIVVRKDVRSEMPK